MWFVQDGLFRELGWLLEQTKIRLYNLDGIDSLTLFAVLVSRDLLESFFTADLAIREVEDSFFFSMAFEESTLVFAMIE